MPTEVKKNVVIISGEHINATAKLIGIDRDEGIIKILIHLRDIETVMVGDIKIVPMSTLGALEL